MHPKVTCRWVITGHVQGVGFRPFVYRLALNYGLTGWVRNQLGQVEVVAQGDSDSLRGFGAALITKAPSIATPHLKSSEVITCESLNAFDIKKSTPTAAPQIQVPPDYFLCEDCLRELNDPDDRRYRYPFINCTQCGPRYTLIKTLPYDRANTTMAIFEMCVDCRMEYEDLANRRFHAEPVACPICGPQLHFEVPEATSINTTKDALSTCLAALKSGRIIAVKGIGGYHLFCDARHDLAIARLRVQKPRPDKPLAVLFPQRGAHGLEAVLKEVFLSDNEANVLASSRRPIVLARKRPSSTLSRLIAPQLSEIGVMLPYSPLHHLVLEDFGGPLVATSGNISGESVLTENEEAAKRLSRVAEAYLHHNRPIERPADDSVFRTIGAKPRPLRLGRGYAPTELDLPFTLDCPVLAVGGHMKNTVALGWENRAVVSPHIGELDALRSQMVFERVIHDLQALYEVDAQQIVCDAHPGYASTRWAHRCGLPVHQVFHHHAHASALAGEHNHRGNWLVFTWDGVGLGEDGSLWGGEAFAGQSGNWQRVSSFRPFYLPGGDKAGRAPWRSAAALCWEVGRAWEAYPEETNLPYHAWRHRLNCPRSTAVGRLFDAAAALTGLLYEASFEGQGPMILEAAAVATEESDSLPIKKTHEDLWEADWEPMLNWLTDESSSVKQRATRFHATMARVVLELSRIIRDERGITSIGLCGGVFQNRLLSDQAKALLEANEFNVRLTEKLPCNDGGLSFGQLIEFGAQITL